MASGGKYNGPLLWVEHYQPWFSASMFIARDDRGGKER